MTLYTLWCDQCMNLLCMICSLGNIARLVCKHSLAIFLCGVEIWNTSCFSQGPVQQFPKGVLPHQPACFVCPQQLSSLLPTQMSGPGERCVYGPTGCRVKQQEQPCAPTFVFKDEKFSIYLVCLKFRKMVISVELLLRAKQNWAVWNFAPTPSIAFQHFMVTCFHFASILFLASVILFLSYCHPK